jgi:hypothetical protein
VLIAYETTLLIAFRAWLEAGVGGAYQRQLSGNSIIEKLKSMSPIATASTGGSVQHGFSAEGCMLGFYEHCSAADKR